MLLYTPVRFPSNANAKHNNKYYNISSITPHFVIIQTLLVHRVCATGFHSIHRDYFKKSNDLKHFDSYYLIIITEYISL